MKRLAACLVLLCCLFPGSAVSALEISRGPDDIYVIDGAGLITAEDLDFIETTAEGLTGYLSANSEQWPDRKTRISVITTVNLEGLEPMEYLEQLSDELLLNTFYEDLCVFIYPSIERPGKLNVAMGRHPDEEATSYLEQWSDLGNASGGIVEIFKDWVLAVLASHGLNPPLSDEEWGFSSESLAPVSPHAAYSSQTNPFIYAGAFGAIAMFMMLRTFQINRRNRKRFGLPRSTYKRKSFSTQPSAFDEDDSKDYLDK